MNASQLRELQYGQAQLFLLRWFPVIYIFPLLSVTSFRVMFPASLALLCFDPLFSYSRRTTPANQPWQRLGYCYAPRRRPLAGRVRPIV